MSGNRLFSKISSWLGLLFVSLLIGGCFVPKTVTEFEPKCELSSKSWVLDQSREGTAGAIKAMEAVLNECRGDECLYIVPIAILVVPVTSLTVSGSFVVLGNTVHWIEKQGRCDESTTRQTITRFTKSMKKMGGKVLHSGKEFVAWLKAI